MWDSMQALDRAAPDTDPYLLATSLRDVFDRHSATFERNRIPVDAGESAPGAAYLDVYFSAVRTLTSWIDGHA
jgi:hypothetical protein